jgi:hypothetical protein
MFVNGFLKFFFQSQTFLDKYNPEQFEIVAFRKGEDGKDLVFTRERDRIQPYFRILVRRRLQG